MQSKLTQCLMTGIALYWQCTTIYVRSCTTSDPLRPVIIGNLRDAKQGTVNSRQYLLKIMIFLARQALLFRGHGNEQEANFTQLYLLRKEDNESLKTWGTEKQINK